jgi:hypothetical protein
LDGQGDSAGDAIGRFGRDPELAMRGGARALYLPSGMLSSTGLNFLFWSIDE